jgi:hypothetical protein
MDVQAGGNKYKTLSRHGRQACSSQKALYALKRCLNGIACGPERLTMNGQAGGKRSR